MFFLFVPINIMHDMCDDYMVNMLSVCAFISYSEYNMNFGIRLKSRHIRQHNGVYASIMLHTHF